MSKDNNKLILISNGRNDQNSQELFVGSSDAALNALGEIEAKRAGRVLKDFGIDVKSVKTCMMLSAAKTCQLVLGAMGRSDLVVETDASEEAENWDNWIVPQVA